MFIPVKLSFELLMEYVGDGGLFEVYRLAMSSGACQPMVPTGEFNAAATAPLFAALEFRDMDTYE